MSFASSLRGVVRAFFMLLPLALSACIVVQDFGKTWEQGFDDPCVQRIAEATVLEGNPRGLPIEQIARSLKVSAHTFLMLRERPEDIGGSLYRYAVNTDAPGGEYVAYRLNEAKREEFTREYGEKVPVIITDEAATIPELNDESLALLARIADREDYWVVADRQPYNPKRRKDCPAMPPVEKAPAEEKPRRALPAPPAPPPPAYQAMPETHDAQETEEPRQ